jgi:hypothetical protein
MIPSWLANAAAFLILWLALAVTLGPFLGTWLKRSAAAQAWPPEYEPDDDEAQRIAEQFAEAAAEEDQRHGLR